MKQYFRQRVYLIVGIIIAVFLSLALLIHAAQKNRQHNNSASLRDKAQQSGGKVVAHKSIEIKNIYNNLEELAGQSAAVVVGKPLGGRGRLSTNETQVGTDYQFEVKEAVKGALHKGDVITIRLPGGTVDFGDGTSASTHVAGDGHKLETGTTYVLFLREKAGIYTFTGGPQGAFAFTKDNVVRSNDHFRSWDPVVKLYQGKDVNEFLKMVRTSVNG